LTRSDASVRPEPLVSAAERTIPESLREVTAQRVLRLSPRAGEALRVASVVGASFDLAVLSRTMNEPEDSVLDGLKEAEVAVLVCEEREVAGRFSFAHALIRDAIAEELGPTRRARLHRRVGEALEDLFGEDADAHIGELAHHWFE